MAPTHWLRPVAGLLALLLWLLSGPHALALGAGLSRNCYTGECLDNSGAAYRFAAAEAARRGLPTATGEPPP